MKGSELRKMVLSSGTVKSFASDMGIGARTLYRYFKVRKVPAHIEGLAGWVAMKRSGKK